MIEAVFTEGDHQVTLKVESLDEIPPKLPMVRDYLHPEERAARHRELMERGRALGLV